MRRSFYAVVAALMAALTLSPTVAEAATVDILLGQIEEEPVFDDRTQAEEGAALFMEAARNSGILVSDEIRIWGPLQFPETSEQGHVSFKSLWGDAWPAVQGELEALSLDVSLTYTPGTGLGANGWTAGRLALVGRGRPTRTTAHEICHLFGCSHVYAYCDEDSGERGIDSIYAPEDPNHCEAETVVPRLGEQNAQIVADMFSEVAGYQPAPSPVSSDAFSVEVRIWPAGQPQLATPETDPVVCTPETWCFSGALEGRPEVFVKIIGPRPNGCLWAQIVKFSPSRAEVFITQLSTGELQYYDLSAVSASGETIPGLQDNRAFCNLP